MYLNKTNGLPLRSRRYIIENFETVKKSTFFHALLYHQSYKWLICLFMPIRNFQLYGFNFPNSNLVFPYTPVLYYGRYLKWFGRTTPSRFNVNLESGWCCPFPCVGGFNQYIIIIMSFFLLYEGCPNKSWTLLITHDCVSGIL